MWSIWLTVLVLFYNLTIIWIPNVSQVLVNKYSCSLVNRYLLDTRQIQKLTPKFHTCQQVLTWHKTNALNIKVFFTSKACSLLSSSFKRRMVKPEKLSTRRTVTWYNAWNECEKMVREQGTIKLFCPHCGLSYNSQSNKLAREQTAMTSENLTGENN